MEHTEITTDQVMSRILARLVTTGVHFEVGFKLVDHGGERGIQIDLARSGKEWHWVQMFYRDVPIDRQISGAIKVLEAVLAECGVD